jgi:hypothetical protein
VAVAPPGRDRKAVMTKPSKDSKKTKKNQKSVKVKDLDTKKNPKGGPIAII